MNVQDEMERIARNRATDWDALLVRNEARVALCKEHYGVTTDEQLVREHLVRYQMAGNKESARGLHINTGLALDEAVPLFKAVGAKRYRRQNEDAWGACASW